MVTNEKEVVRTLSQSGKVGILVALWKNPPVKDGPKEFRGHARGYVQQRVTSPFELDYIPRAFPDPLLQFVYVVLVGLTAHAGDRRLSVATAFEISLLTSIATRPYSCRSLASDHWRDRMADASPYPDGGGELRGGGEAGDRLGARWDCLYLRCTIATLLTNKINLQSVFIPEVFRPIYTTRYPAVFVTNLAWTRSPRYPSISQDCHRDSRVNSAWKMVSYIGINSRIKVK